jgi:hypothetical protein
MRELFVELSESLIDTLRGIGEEAVRRTAPAPVSNSRIQSLIESWYWATFNSRYGWICYETIRSQRDDSIIIRARRLCGHGAGKIEIPEFKLRVASIPEQYDIVDQCVANARRCYCVERQL